MLKKNMEDKPVRIYIKLPLYSIDFNKDKINLVYKFHIKKSSFSIFFTKNKRLSNKILFPNSRY